jgi:hypothetical protein
MLELPPACDGGDGASGLPSSTLTFDPLALLAPCVVPIVGFFATRLLKAGQPLQPSAPPVPSHLPPPGQVPFGIWSAGRKPDPQSLAELPFRSSSDASSCDCLFPEIAALGGRLRLVGREEFLALKYRPQALQMISPCVDRRHNGVRVVPQLLRTITVSFSAWSNRSDRVDKPAHLSIHIFGAFCFT